MKTVLVAAALVLAGAIAAGAQEVPVPAPPLLAHPEGPGAPPVTITLQDALQRARQNETQFQAVVADAAVAREDRVQAKAGLLPAFSATTQYLGNQATPDNVNPNGRFVSMDGVNMYRAWAVMRQDLSPGVFMRTPLHKAEAAEAMAAARLEIAQRGLAVTVTRNYYGLVAAQRKYATAQLAAQQAARFLENVRRQEQLGQIARSDVVKAEIQHEQQQQGFREATLAMDNARLALAVLLSPDSRRKLLGRRRHAGRSGPAAVRRHQDRWRSAATPICAWPASRSKRRGRTSGPRRTPSCRAWWSTRCTASRRTSSRLHSRIAAQPELGVLPNLGYFVTVNLSVPLWDWGGLRSKLHQSETRERQAQTTLSQTQRQLVSNLYSKYNETLTARASTDNLRRIVDLASESLRLLVLRYQAGESTILEVVDGQNTLVQARNAADDAETRYRVALADLQTLTGPF